MVGKRKRQPPAEEGEEVLASIAGSDVSSSETTSDEAASVMVYTAAELAHGVETIVQLLAPWTTSLLVKLTVNNGEYLRIWVEDRKSKNQWQTDKLATLDFVGVNAALPGATVVDYATCFINCLNASNDDDNSVEIVHSDGEDGDLELHLGIIVRVFVAEWKPKYTFLLKHIELEPVDRVFATLRDQEEKLNEQDAKIAALEHLVRALTQQPSQASQNPQTPRRQDSRAPMFVRVQGTKKVGKDHVIPWKLSSCEPSAESREHGLHVAAHHILVEKPGVFAVHVHVLHNRPGDGVVFELLVNGTAVATCVDAEASLSSLTHVVRVVRNDMLSVVYRGHGSAYKDSYLVAYELR